MRIAVPADLPPETVGHGRVWRRVLGELRGLADVVGGPDVEADVWLVDGHAPLPALPERAPVVAFVHEAPWTVPELRDLTSPEFTAWIETTTAAAAARATRIVTASGAAADQIADGLGVGAHRVDVVPHGVDHAVFHPGAERPSLGPPYVLFAASVHPRKNLAALRGAVTDLHGDGISLPLVVVAAPALDRADSRALEAAAFAPLPGGLTRVERPSDAALAGLMAGCAAFVLPSLWEGFGLTALEAMACGAPVVVADRGPLPEVVGEAGLVCEPTAPAIAAALRGLLGDPERAAALGRAGAERAAAFTWRRSAEGWLDALERAAREPL